MSRCLLITGATGLVGAYLLDRLAGQPGLDLHAIVRPHPGADPAARLALLAPYFGRTDGFAGVHVHAGDVTRPRLGLAPAAWRRLRREVTDIVHAAGLVAFRASPRLQEVNVGGLERVLEFRPPEARLFHLSTAYVAGRHAGPFAETDLACGQSFRNAYEASKFAAELRLGAVAPAAAAATTVLRPSILVGEAVTGRTFQFLTLYAVLRLLREYARRCPGAELALPHAPAGTQNYLPIDCFAAMVVEVIREPRHWGGTWHLVHPRPLLNRDLGRLLEALLGVRFVNRRPSRQDPPLNRVLTARTAPYLAYLMGEPHFACPRLATLAAPPPPPLGRAFLERTLAWSEACHWESTRALGLL